MRGFEPIPSSLISDARLTLQARAVYGVLRNLVWQETHASEDTMTAEVGTLDDIARAAGCGTTALKGYLAELRDHGWLTVVRKRRGHPYTLTVYSDPVSTETESDSVAHADDAPTEAESGSVQRRNPSHSRAGGSSSGSNETDGGGADAPPRPRDELWDLLEERFGRVPAKTNAHKKRNVAVADLRKLGATPDSIRHALDAWCRNFAGATVTDIALATHYPQLTAGYERHVDDEASPAPPMRPVSIAPIAVPARRVAAAAAAWSTIDRDLAAALKADTHEQWFADVVAADLRAGALVLAIPSDFVCDWITSHFAGLIGAAASDLSGVDRVEFRVGRLIVIEEEPGETTERVYRRWVVTHAADVAFPLEEIHIVIDSEFVDADDVDRQELHELADATRASSSSEAPAAEAQGRRAA